MIDYLNGNAVLRDFYEHAPDIEGIKKAIENKKDNYSQRALLVQQLNKQYGQLDTSAAVKDNLQSLGSPLTFTVCTAHQPCIFTGPLYVIYKILHACKLAEYLNVQLPDYKFVPVYYMGSEDADLQELGTMQVQGKKYQWATDQQGAVGRMLVDDQLLCLLNELEGQLSINDKGRKHISLLRRCYQSGMTIAAATFLVLNELFQQYGLIVLNPDNVHLKRSFIPVLERELKEGFSQNALIQTISRIPAKYKVQSAGRPVNLFYLQHQLRSRIERTADGYIINETGLAFTAAEMMKELHAHPDAFSPNVILRPLLQEHVLPNVAFIGGGGELAYWLELKEVFKEVSIPYPVLVLRNSFSLLSKKSSQMITSLGLSNADFFMKENELQKKWILGTEDLTKDLESALHSMRQLYSNIQQLAAKADVTLATHVSALHKNAEKKIMQLEQKIIRAQKKKHASSMAKIRHLFSQLYPGGILQERVDNYFGVDIEDQNDLIKLIYDNSKALDQLFCMIQLQ